MFLLLRIQLQLANYDREDTLEIYLEKAICFSRECGVRFPVKRDTLCPPRIDQLTREVEILLFVPKSEKMKLMNPTQLRVLNNWINPKERCALKHGGFDFSPTPAFERIHLADAESRAPARPVSFKFHEAFWINLSWNFLLSFRHQILIPGS